MAARTTGVRRPGRLGGAPGQRREMEALADRDAGARPGPYEGLAVGDADAPGDADGVGTGVGRGVGIGPETGGNATGIGRP